MATVKSTAAIVVLLLLAAILPSHARPMTRYGGAATKGQRKKGWRRRAQDYTEAKANTQTTTFVTNPSSLNGSKGKGKGKEVVYTEEDNDGRTTFVVDCDEMTYRKAVGGETRAVGKAGIKAVEKAGKGKGKAGGLSRSSTDTVSGASTKSIPSGICDNVDGDGSETSGGGWWSGDGGSGDGGGLGDSGTGSGAVVEGEVDVEVVPVDPSADYPDPGYGTGDTAYSGLYGCDEVAAGAAPETGDLERVTVTLDVIHEIEQNVQDGGSQGILELMKMDLQDNVAPVIADCITDDDTISPSGSAMTISSGSGSGSAYGSGTVITNVVFDDLSGDSTACTQDYQDYAALSEGKCMLTTIPVDLYYNGTDTSDFTERVETAIAGHMWDVPGLMMTSTIHKGGGASITAIEVDQVEADDSKIGPAGFLTIAAAAVVLLLVALMLVRRKRKEEMVKHVSLDDDDDTYLRDIEGESHGSADRLANVVGEDGDSVNTGWTGANTHFRNASAMDTYLSNTESRPSHQDVHICSSATCEVCERNRQAGVQFIPSETNLSVPSQAPLPPDAPRQYTAEDTVTL